MNCLEARSFTIRGMSILLQKLHMYITFAKDLYSYVEQVEIIMSSGTPSFFQCAHHLQFEYTVMSNRWK